MIEPSSSTAVLGLGPSGDTHPISVSLIICAYTLQRWDDLCAAVQSVLAMSRQPNEIIVVADYNDTLLAKIKAQWSGLSIIANEDNCGLSGARNTGVRHAKGQLIAFLDDDAIAATDWLESLIKPFADDRVYGTTSRIKPRWKGKQPPWFPEEFFWVVGCSYEGLPGRASQVRNVMGAAMCLRSGVFDAAGGFTKALGRAQGKLPISCEETELCIRAARAIDGISFVYEPASVIEHRVTGERLTLGYFLKRCYAEGVSKHRVAALHQKGSPLSTEVNYVLKILPRGVARGIGDALVRADISGFGRAASILLGLAATISGYAADWGADTLGALSHRNRGAEAAPVKSTTGSL